VGSFSVSVEDEPPQDIRNKELLSRSAIFNDFAFLFKTVKLDSLFAMIVLTCKFLNLIIIF